MCRTGTLDRKGRAACYKGKNALRHARNLVLWLGSSVRKHKIFACEIIHVHTEITSAVRKTETLRVRNPYRQLFRDLRDTGGLQPCNIAPACALIFLQYLQNRGEMRSPRIHKTRPGPKE